MIRIDKSSRKFDHGVGFSKGCAELTLKKPPPLVPSCLMAICEAAGPTAMTCSVSVDFLVFGCPCSSSTGLPSMSVTGSSYWLGCTTVAVAYGLNVCTTPWETSTSASTDRKSTRLNSSHLGISYAVFCLKKKKKNKNKMRPMNDAKMDDKY